MGKVYVLAKADSAIQQTVSPQGMGLTINTSPENLDYNKFGTSGSSQNKVARKFGNVGAKARFGLGALGGLNAFYNATSSGQPGAISSIGSGAMSGYYGSQGLENLAAKQGAKIGVKRDNRESAAAYDEAQGENQQRDAMSMLPEYNRQMNFNQNKVGVTQPPAVSPQIGNQPGQLGHTPGPNADNSITQNMPGGQVAVSPTLTEDNSQQATLQQPQPVAVTGANNGQPPVPKVLTPEELKASQGENVLPDGSSGATIAGG